MNLAHKDDEYETPPWVLNQITETTGKRIDTDMCATDANCVGLCYVDKEQDALKHVFEYFYPEEILFCNPPRSINGKFVKFCVDLWKKENMNLVMMLSWNDLGNKYSDELRQYILEGKIVPYNLGKIKFYKNGKESQFPSRLTYFWAWFK